MREQMDVDPGSRARAHVLAARGAGAGCGAGHGHRLGLHPCSRNQPLAQLEAEVEGELLDGMTVPFARRPDTSAA